MQKHIKAHRSINESVRKVRSLNENFVFPDLVWADDDLPTGADEDDVAYYAKKVMKSEYGVKPDVVKTVRMRGSSGGYPDIHVEFNDESEARKFLTNYLGGAGMENEIEEWMNIASGGASE